MNTQSCIKPAVVHMTETLIVNMHEVQLILTHQYSRTMGIRISDGPCLTGGSNISAGSRAAYEMQTRPQRPSSHHGFIGTVVAASARRRRVISIMTALLAAVVDPGLPQACAQGLHAVRCEGRG